MRAHPALAAAEREEGLYAGCCAATHQPRELTHVCVEMELVRGGSIAARVLAFAAQWARDDAADIAAGGRGNPHGVRSHAHVMLVRKWIAQAASALAEYVRPLSLCARSDLLTDMYSLPPLLLLTLNLPTNNLLLTLYWCSLLHPPPLTLYLLSYNYTLHRFNLPGTTATFCGTSPCVPTRCC